MKRITSLFLLLFTHFVFAQFTAEDVKFFVGEGPQTAYLVIDFKDGTDDRSYAWGYQFNEADEPTFSDILDAIEAAEPEFSVDKTAFLSDIFYNNHSGLAGDPDYWSTWKGSDPQSFVMNGGIGEDLQDGYWYGCSYGFSNPTSEAPVTPIPAYNSQWYSDTDITQWIGTGTNHSIIIVDFGTTTDATEDSYAFGIKYDGTISALDALEMIQLETGSFSYTMGESNIDTINYLDFIGTNTTSQPVSIYSGTNLSNWQTQTDLSAVSLSNYQWLGISFGERRPYTPQEADQALSTNTPDQLQIVLYPNPVEHTLNISGINEALQVSIFNMMGKAVLKTQESQIDVQDLASGLYVIHIKSEHGETVKKFIKN